MTDIEKKIFRFCFKFEIDSGTKNTAENPFESKISGFSFKIIFLNRKILDNNLKNKKNILFLLAFV